MTRRIRGIKKEVRSVDDSGKGQIGCGRFGGMILVCWYMYECISFHVHTKRSGLYGKCDTDVGSKKPAPS